MIRALLFATALSLPAVATAQTGTQAGELGSRLGKLEKELRSVQRTVFPGGTPVQPELGGTAPATPAGTPATGVITDLTTRLDGVEKALATLTGQVEQDGARLRKHDDALKAIEARVARLEGNTASAGDTASAASLPPVRLTTSSPVRLATPAPRTDPPARVDPARRALVAAVEMPATGDAIEDAYTYGFRLYTAKLYPEAQAKLKEFVAAHPTHKRASYAQNLLGRAYLDEGKPALASVAFYDNYQKLPKGERAPESLYWLGRALTKLNKRADACKVYDEMREVYGADMTRDAMAKVARGRADAKCAP